VYDLRELCPSKAGDGFPGYWLAVGEHCRRLGVPLAQFEQAAPDESGCVRQYRRQNAPEAHFELEARPEVGLIRVGLDIESPGLFRAMQPVLESGRLRLQGILGTGIQFRETAGSGTVSEWLPFDPLDPECARSAALRLSSYIGALNPLLDRLLGTGGG
jgi:hypothetical protein